MHKTTAWPLALIYAALVVYASLYPFADWRDQGLPPLSFLMAPLPGPLGPRLSVAAADVRGEWLLFLRPGAELDPEWVGETTHFIERAPAEMAAVFTPEQGPKGQGSLWSDLLAVFRARQSVLKPGRGLLISKSLYRQLGGHRDVADPEADLLGRIGKARISVLRSAISFREP